MLTVNRPTDIPPWDLGATPLAAVPWLIRLRGRQRLRGHRARGGVADAGFDFPLRRLAPLMAASACANVAWPSGCRGVSRFPALAALGLALDVALLTGLLELTGGPFNPFSVIFLVQIAHAALTLGQIYALGIGACAAGRIWTPGLLAYDRARSRASPLNDFPTHLFTMWIAVAATAELAAYFIVQASNALARREEEIESMRAQAARTEHLVSLTTLAAGAAHELSTPLATIALASRELERAAIAHATNPGLAEDARLDTR